MENFYITYSNNSNLAHCFSKVPARDYSAARATVNCAIGSSFAFMYDDEDFSGQVEKYGLTEVPLQAQVKLR